MDFLVWGSLVDRENSRTARATQKNPVSKKIAKTSHNHLLKKTACFICSLEICYVYIIYLQYFYLCLLFIRSHWACFQHVFLQLACPFFLHNVVLLMHMGIGPSTQAWAAYHQRSCTREVIPPTHWPVAPQLGCGLNSTSFFMLEFLPGFTLCW